MGRGDLQRCELRDVSQNGFAFEWPGDGQVGHKKMLIYEQRDWSPYVQEGYENGTAFYGTKGMLILGKLGGWKMYGPKNKLIEEMSGAPDLAAHHQNFLDCIRTGEKPHADIEINHLSPRVIDQYRTFFKMLQVAFIDQVFCLRSFRDMEGDHIRSF